MRSFLDRNRRISVLVRGLVALSLLIGSTTAVAKPAAPGKEVRPASSSQGVVNLNTANEAQLCYLPRIGPAKARAIIKHRTRQAFRSDAELVRVKGIGRKTYRLIRGFVTLQGETTLTRKAKLDSP